MNLTRRHFIRTAAAFTAGFAGLRTLVASERALAGEGAKGIAGYGPLVTDANKVLDLPADFSYRIFSRGGEKMSDGFLVPRLHDGMAAFPGPDGRTLLVRNHENSPGGGSAFGKEYELFDRIDSALVYDRGFGKSPGAGGTTTLVYNTQTQELEKHYLSLAGTERNCAGGPTPWNSWITCEETVARSDDKHELDHGYNFEVPADAGKPVAPVPLKRMGRFNHEAIAVDPKSGCVYQTEDREDGLIYRYVPEKPGDLAAGGKLQALRVRDQQSLDTRNWGKLCLISPGQSLDVEWIDLDEVESPDDDLRHRGFVAGAARFARGEGMWYGRDAIYFACTSGGSAGKGQIWRYVPSAVEAQPGEKDSPGRLELFIEPNDGALIENCDNLTVAPWGDIVISEDGGKPNNIVGIRPDGGLYTIGSNPHNGSEIAGVTFSPDGTTLFANIQGEGITLAITGPWDRIRA